MILTMEDELRFTEVTMKNVLLLTSLMCMHLLNMFLIEMSKFWAFSYKMLIGIRLMSWACFILMLFAFPLWIFFQ